MDLEDSVDELQQIAEYRRARKILRAAGTGGIIFGLLALGVGGIMLQQSPLNIILILIGLFLLAEGIWNVAFPTAEGVIVDGVALTLVGLWNIFITLLNAAAGVGEGAHWGVIGFFQIGYGIYRFLSYGRFARAFQTKPPPEDLQRMEELVRNIQLTLPDSAEDLIAFQTKGFFKQQHWKGQLAGRAALFVDNTGHDVLIAYKTEVDITARGKVLIGRTLKASFHIRDMNLNGLISPEYFAKYERWKLAADEPLAEPEENSAEA